MENSVLLIIGIMIVPWVIGGIFFAIKDHDSNPYPKIEDKESSLTAPTWPDDYIRIYYNGLFETLKKPKVAELYCELQKVNKGKLKDRKPDKHDLWFDANIKNFCKYGEILAYIALYGNLTDRFIAGLKNPQYDEEFQRHLVSIYQNRYDKRYHLNCQNLLWYYLERWDLLPCIRRTIIEDERFEQALNMYKRQRGEIYL